MTTPNLVRPDLADPKMDLNVVLYENQISPDDGDEDLTEWNVRFFKNDDIQTYIFGHPSSGIRWAIVIPVESDDDEETNLVLSSLDQVLQAAWLATVMQMTEQSGDSR